MKYYNKFLESKFKESKKVTNSYISWLLNNKDIETLTPIDKWYTELADIEVAKRLILEFFKFFEKYHITQIRINEFYRELEAGDTIEASDGIEYSEKILFYFEWLMIQDVEDLWIGVKRLVANGLDDGEALATYNKEIKDSILKQPCSR